MISLTVWAELDLCHSSSFESCNMSFFHIKIWVIYFHNNLENKNSCAPTVFKNLKPSLIYFTQQIFFKKKRVLTSDMYSNSIHMGSCFITTPNRHMILGCFNSDMSSISLWKSACVFALAFSFRDLTATNILPVFIFNSPLYTLPEKKSEAYLLYV